MNLTFEQIISATRGVAWTECTDDSIVFHRFTAEQEQLYSGNQYIKAFATAGVIMEFDTDSSHIALSVNALKGSSRRFFTHSIFVDGQRIGGFGGEFDEDWTPVLCKGEFDLGSGTKRVKIIFPWSAASRVRSLTLDDGASLTPVKKARKVLIFGDSITQGYDSTLPENAYASQLVQWLDADGVNKAIGGETFLPQLAASPDAFVPDLITVAYGTNDWCHKERDAFLEDSWGFYRNLRRTYPDTRIIAMAPIWRADCDRELPAGPFEGVSELLAQIIEEIGNAVLIDCVNLVPHRCDIFSDQYLHPNDSGFQYYGAGLKEKFAELGI